MIFPGGWPEAMALALAEGDLAVDHGDVPIGAIVVDESGAVLGRGHNVRVRDHDPLAHAEIVALRDSAGRRGSWRLDDCALVVTLEPCTMCAGAIVQARVGTLVFGAYDPKAGAVASLFDVVRDVRLPHRPTVVGGIEADACAARLTSFFQPLR